MYFCFQVLHLLTLNVYFFKLTGGGKKRFKAKNVKQKTEHAAHALKFDILLLKHQLRVTITYIILTCEHFFYTSDIGPNYCDYFFCAKLKFMRGKLLNTIVELLSGVLFGGPQQPPCKFKPIKYHLRAFSCRVDLPQGTNPFSFIFNSITQCTAAPDLTD